MFVTALFPNYVLILYNGISDRWFTTNVPPLLCALSFSLDFLILLVNFLLQIRSIVNCLSNSIKFLNCSLSSDLDLLCNASCFYSSDPTPCVKHCSLTCRNELLDYYPEPVVSEAPSSSSNSSNCVYKVANDFLVLLRSFFIFYIWLVWLD